METSETLMISALKHGQCPSQENPAVRAMRPFSLGSVTTKRARKAPTRPTPEQRKQRANHPLVVRLRYAIARSKSGPDGKPLGSVELSQKAEMADTYISALVNGHIDPDNIKTDTLRRLASALDVTPEWLMTGEQGPPSSPEIEGEPWPAFEEAAMRARESGASSAAVNSVRVGRGAYKEALSAKELFDLMIEAEQEIRRGKKKLDLGPLDDD